MKETVLFDMDNTLFDFSTPYKRALQKEPGIIYPQSQHKFFEDLEPLPGAVDAYFAIKRKYHVKIVSRPSVYNKLCYTEKAISIEKHLGFDELENFKLSCDKTSDKGHYLIDDCMQMGKFEPEWEHIHFGTEKFPNWKAVTDYLLFKTKIY